MREQTYAVRLGDTTQHLVRYQHQHEQLFLLRLHGNEVDAQTVGRDWVLRQGGVFLDVVSSTREINFELAGAHFQFDPNRIFHEDGIKNTLRDYECDSALPVVAEVNKFAAAVVQQCQSQACIVALHNNQNYNLRYYLPGGACADAALDWFMNETISAHNFVLVTQVQDFKALKERGVNVVLERVDAALPTGSFSEYCFQKRIRYFNIETKFGDAAYQKQLLDTVAAVIKSSSTD